MPLPLANFLKIGNCQSEIGNVLIFVFVLVFVVTLLFYNVQLDGIESNNFEISSTFLA